MIGIVLGLALLVFLAYKGYSIIWVAPVSAMVVALTGGLSSATCIYRHLYAGACRFCQILVSNVSFGSDFRKGDGSYGGGSFCGKKIVLNDRSPEGNPGGDYQLRYFGLWRNFTVCGCVRHLSDCRILIPGG